MKVLSSSEIQEISGGYNEITGSPNGLISISAGIIDAVQYFKRYPCQTQFDLTTAKCLMSQSIDAAKYGAIGFLTAAYKIQRG